MSDGEGVIEIHIYALPVRADPDNVLESVFHQAEDAGMNLSGLHLVFYLLFGHVFQYDQATVFESDVIVVPLFDDGRDLAPCLDFRLEVCDEIRLPVAEVIFVE